MKKHERIALAFLLALSLCGYAPLAEAQAPLRCGPFIQGELAPPTPRQNGHARARFEQINTAVKTQPYRLLFLGDSLTEGFDREVWEQHMGRRGVLNAGVGGDRTDHLRWRLEHGNLDGPPPHGIVLLIGTNDLGHEWPPALAAEGIRATLLKLRQRVPGAAILLLGLWPREDIPRIVERHEIAAVNRMIETCADGNAIRYADLGRLLLGPDGRLLPGISPDRLHFNTQGYARLAPALDREIDKLLGTRAAPTVATVMPRLPADNAEIVQVPTVATKNDEIIVQGTINGRPVTFEVDSGASIVNIPLPIAKKLTLGTPQDIGRMTFADGRTDECPIYQIASLRIGDAEIHDIPASVCGNGNTILLGRAALNKFTSWSVDTHSGMLLLIR
jgi:clan AA aspartic protease (TIGR02281 family)